MFLFGHIGITIGIFFILGYLQPDIRIRYWFVGLGAILPDIVDKFLGRVLFADSLANGRIIAHTGIFSIMLFVFSYYCYKCRNDSRMLFTSGATFLHILEDRIWIEPQILFWPLYGWTFSPGIPEDHWIGYFLNMFQDSINPVFSFDFISETIGFIFVIFIVVYFNRRKK